MALSRNILAPGLASFLTDVSTEMIYPLLPLFLTTVLGAHVLFVGLVEGVTETTASVLKLFSGWWSDRLGERKSYLFLRILPFHSCPSLGSHGYRLLAYGLFSG